MKIGVKTDYTNILARLECISDPYALVPILVVDVCGDPNGVFYVLRLVWQVTSSTITHWASVGEVGNSILLGSTGCNEGGGISKYVANSSVPFWVKDKSKVRPGAPLGCLWVGFGCPLGDLLVSFLRKSRAP